MRAGSPGPHWLQAPPTPGLPQSPPTSVCPASSCCSRTFAASASSSPLLLLSMATPTQTPTVAPEEFDPFFYDYATVQTVGMTLATIMFLLGIIIIVSKKVKCRKADSSPTCKSCKSELPSSGEAPGGGGV
ncbi:PREDICTED: FXYD domain-containing ion transport regulator 7 isoform X3 [Chinchilla lanigera]|uniref:FXYD domain-containing ion transport regulator 7 isoform X3 n=1 Tax=Chinchilla lanigera TaxID=34839 RepID=UPI00038ED95D|nr:PREDICTED: FXYD domain-containing ion transport regulator 7 isoform X3 [Chinchilla lanigera]